MILITSRNQGFAWNHHGGVHAKGYLFDRSGAFRRGEALVDYFAAAEADRFRDQVHGANGAFAAVLETGRHVLAAVDRVRSIPLFYARKGPQLVLGDDAHDVQRELGGAEIDPVAREELLRVAYTVGPSTLDPRIRQIEAGELLVFDKASGETSTRTYFRHAHGDYTDKAEEVLVEELDAITSRWARRLIDSAEGRTIVVALSGGYDSRSIVCALKRAGYPDVVCYSYGVPASFEWPIAQKVAERVGYPIHVIEYNRQRWQALVESPRLAEFCRFASHRCAVPCVQELLAWEMLSQQNAVPADSIVVPGYCGDLQGGSYVPAEVQNRVPDKVLAEGIDSYLLGRLFTLRASPIAPETREAILRRIHAYTSQFKSDDIESFCSVLEDWFTRHKVAKFVVNAVRVYELFGHEWRLPLWDNELIEWWYRIPLRLRTNSVLYHRYLFERLFDPLGVGFRQPASPARLDLLAARYLPAALIPWARAFYRLTFAKIRKKPVDIDGWDDVSSLLLERLPAEWDGRDFTFVNGIVAAWCLLNDF